MNRESGQALIEFSLSLVLLMVAITGAGGILKAQWDRARCAHRVFENARLALNRSNQTITLQESCGGAMESTTLYKLERSR